MPYNLCWGQLYHNDIFKTIKMNSEIKNMPILEEVYSTHFYIWIAFWISFLINQ